MSVQSLERGLVLIRQLARSGREGARLLDLHRATRLPKSTIHRLLEALRSQGFVEQMAGTRRYRLGTEIAWLGRAAAQDLDEIGRGCEASLVHLAAETGDTAFLCVRSGLESICLGRHSGALALRTFTVNVGVRRPLGIGASGIAFLASMRDDELDATLAQIGSGIAAWRLSRAELGHAIGAARQKGYAFSDGYTLPDVRGVAKLVRGRHGEPVAALALAAPSSRINDARLPRLLEKLEARVEEAEERLYAIGRRAPAELRA